MSIKNYFRISNFIAMFLAFSIGAVVGSQEVLTHFAKDKNTYAATLAGIFFIFNLSIEYGASWKLRRQGYELRTKVFDNPMLRTFLFRIVMLVIGGWIVLARYELGGIFSYLTLSMLVAFFVGGAFESYRLLKENV